MTGTLIPVEGTAPVYWACYLVNGDPEGLSDADRVAADSFVDWLGGRVVTCSEESFFTRHHDAKRFGVLAADCFTYTALIESKPA